MINIKLYCKTKSKEELKVSVATESSLPEVALMQ